MTMQFTIRSRMLGVLLWACTRRRHAWARPSVCCLFLRAYRPIPFIFLIMILAEGLHTILRCFLMYSLCFASKEWTHQKHCFVYSILADFEHIRRVLKFLVTFGYNILQLYLFLVNNYPIPKHTLKKSNNLELLPSIIIKLLSDYRPIRMKHFG